MPQLHRLGGFVAQWYDDVVDRNQASPVRVEPSDSFPNVNFLLPLGATISGQVADGETGLPISGMEVRARLNDRDISETKTRSDGTYKLLGVPAGQIQVAVSGLGYFEQRRSITVSEGEEIAGVDF